MSIRELVAKQLELAAKATTVPTHRRAIKVINYLKKHYNATPIKNWSSNAYSDSQSLEARLTPARGNKFIKELQEQGWGVKQKKFQGKHYENSVYYDALHPATGMRITITQFAKQDVMSNRAMCNVTVFGDKKAKPTTLPYYD